MITKSKHVEAVIRKHWRELIRGGWRKPMFLWIRPKHPPQLRYALGRTNANGKGQGNHTLSFHANPYFGCVTTTRFNNRETWIAEIR